VLLRSEPGQPACTDARTALAECISCARATARQFRRGWLQAIGAPDYQAYLAHHAERHPGTAPMSEKDYVAMFMEHRFNRRGAARCC